MEDLLEESKEESMQHERIGDDAFKKFYA